MKKLTINQALDLLTTKYPSKENKPTDVLTLHERLVFSKVEWGGNTFVENTNKVVNIINFGTADPTAWK